MHPESNCPRLEEKDFSAAVFDLDGVITETAQVHARAWKSMFDDYLQARSNRDRRHYAPFHRDSDYRQHVDGKPRYDGVKDFLASRNIELPYGDPDDPPDRETICGLGNRKNAIFLDLIRREGVTAYPHARALLDRLRRSGIRLAVVSSSRNCAEILASAGLDDRFEVRVDGNDLKTFDLAGKPQPDIFLEACRRLGVSRERTAVLEDSVAGVQAGKRGHFGCVVGVDRGGNEKALLDHGADLVVQDLSQLGMAREEPGTPLPAENHLSDILPIDRSLALFLDYDGTLTPIVDRPEDAVLHAPMRDRLRRLAQIFPVAILSGRDLDDVAHLVDIDGIAYAGSHGFDIRTPQGEHVEYEPGKAFLPTLDAAQEQLETALDGIPGCHVERKRFAIAVHYRQVEERYHTRVREGVEAVQADQPRLRLSHGKKIHEFHPDIDWNKGKALRWLMDSLSLDAEAFVPVYLGDDTTDEDAFAEIAEDGVGIVVADSPLASSARYRLGSPAAVGDFLDLLIREKNREL